MPVTPITLFDDPELLFEAPATTPTGVDHLQPATIGIATVSNRLREIVRRLSPDGYDHPGNMIDAVNVDRARHQAAFSG